jgi:ribonucleoside-diphosphate reductase alpha chain
MQAAAQALVDSSISKTVNCPEDIGFGAFAEIYVEGYHLGLKGLTTYRPNAVTGSILSVAETAKPVPKAEEPLAPRADQLHGTTYKLKWPESAHAVYVTINDVDLDGQRRPFEMFINSKNMEHYAWTLGLTRMISAVFRRSSDVAFVAEELKAVFDPRGGAWMQGRYVPSLLAAIGDIVERHLTGLIVAEAPAKAFEPQARPLPLCPQCGASSLIKVEGCNNCLECGYSKCS